MTPPYKRMWFPNDAVIEMCVWGGRTFGFFVPNATFVALTACTHDEAERVDANGCDGYARSAAFVQKVISRLAPSEVDTITPISDLLKIGEVDVR
jgi:hypothetical protein